MDRIKRLSFEVMNDHKSKFNEDFVETIDEDEKIDEGEEKITKTRKKRRKDQNEHRTVV